MVSRDESLVGEATFKKWPLQASSNNVSDQLLEMLTTNHKSSLNLDCKGCQPDSQNCTCTLNSISFENKFAVFVLLEIGHLSMTKWCPLEEIESDFFFCDADRRHKISASYICDGLVHCPKTGADEAFSVCKSLDVGLIAVAVSGSILLLALLICLTLVCCRRWWPGLSN